MSELRKTLAASGAVIATGGALLLSGCGSGESPADKYQAGQARYSRISRVARKFVRAMTHEAEAPEDSWVPSSISCTRAVKVGYLGNSQVEELKTPRRHLRPGDECVITVGADKQIEATIYIDKPEAAFDGNIIEDISVTGLAGCSVEFTNTQPPEGWLVWYPYSSSGSPTNVGQAERLDNDGIGCLDTIMSVLL